MEEKINQNGPIYKVPPPIDTSDTPIAPKGKFPHLILGIVFLIAIAGAIVAGIYYWQTVKQIPATIDFPVHKEQERKIYTNQEYSFEIKYPAEWTFKLGDGTTTIPAKEIFNLVIIGQRQDTNGVSFDDGAALGFMVNDNLSDEIQKYTAIGKGENSFSAYGFFGFQYITKGDELIRAYKILPTGKVIVFTWSRADIYSSNDFSYEKYLLPILSTFKFIEAASAINSFAQCVEAGGSMPPSNPIKCVSPEGLIFTKYETCIQVVAQARNPNTGEWREFPTPCDIPEGWLRGQ